MSIIFKFFDTFLFIYMYIEDARKLVMIPIVLQMYPKNLVNNFPLYVNSKVEIQVILYRRL